MKVSVCLEHNSLIEAWVLGVPRCHKRLWFDVCDDPDLPNTACRQVEMQLVPADARVWWCFEHECTFQKDYLINCDAKEGNERAEDYVSIGSLSRPCRRVGAWLTVEAPE